MNSISPKWFTFDKLFFPNFFPFQQLEAAAARAAEEEKKRLQTQVELQDRFSLELEREKMVSGSCSEWCQLRLQAVVSSSAVTSLTCSHQKVSAELAGGWRMQSALHLLEM